MNFIIVLYTWMSACIEIIFSYNMIFIFVLYIWQFDFFFIFGIECAWWSTNWFGLLTIKIKTWNIIVLTFSKLEKYLILIIFTVISENSSYQTTKSTIINNMNNIFFMLTKFRCSSTGSWRFYHAFNGINVILMIESKSDDASSLFRFARLYIWQCIIFYLFLII